MQTINLDFQNNGYDRMMIDNDKMKPHSMFIKTVKFGGMKKNEESRFDQSGNIIDKKQKKNFHVSYVDEISK